jgi:epidermal growth factor receptor substrate 15
MKNFFLFLLLVIPFLGISQTLDVRFDGSISNIDLAKKEGGVTVTIIQNGQTISSGTSGTNGRYSVKGKIDHTKPFDVVISKSGFVSKKINFNFAGMNLEDIPAGEFKPVESLDTDVFANRPGVDFSFLNTQPVGKFTWNQQGFVAVDEKDKNIMAAKIDKLLKDSEQKAQNNDVAYNAAIQAADKAYNEKKYQEALTKYEEAVKYKPKEQHPINRINEIDGILQKQKQDNLAFEQDNAAYFNLIKAADNLRNAGDYAGAKEKYNEALDLKEEQYPRDEIAKINKLVKEKENEEKYKRLVEAADIMYKQKSFQSARDNYAEASKLKPNEQYPKDKIKELEDKIKAEQDATALKQKYEDLVAQGEQLVKEEKWEEAKGKFDEALKIESASTYVKGQLDFINKKLAEIKAEKDKQEKIAKLLQEGEQGITAKTYDVALAKFKEVLTLDNANTVAPQKITQIEQILAEAAKNKELNDKFNALVKQGDDAVTAKKYPDAITKYKEAIALKEDPAVKIKLESAEKVLSDIENAKKLDEDFAKLISEGQAAFTAKDYTASLAKYEAAILIKPTDQPTLTKISDIKKIIADQQSASEKQQKIEKLISEGVSLMEGGVMDSPQLEPAKAKFNEVLALDPQNATAKTKIAEIDKLLKDAKDLADKDAKFKDNVAKGDTEFSNQAWDKAISFYNVALGIKDDAAVRQKVADAQSKMGEAAAAKQLEADYQKAITDGAALKTAKKYPEALAKFEQAKSLKPAEALPQQEINAINQLLAEQQSAADKQKQITGLLAEGETLFGSKDYIASKGKFEQVLGLDNANATAKKRITDIEAELAKLAGEAEKQQQIAQLIKDGEGLFTSTQYEASEAKFKQVLTLDQSNATAKKYLSDIAAKLAELKQQADTEAKFNALVTQGDAAVSNTKWQDAVTAYNSALALKPDAGVQQKRDAAQQKLGELSQEQETNAKYAAAISAADGLRNSGKHQEAIAKYTEAKSIKPGETYPQTEIDKINQLIAESNNKAEAQAKITALLNEGNMLFTSKDYPSAKAKYQEVLTLDPANETAKKQLKEIENQENALLSEKAKDEEFKQLKASGLQAAAIQDYNNAMMHFEKALKIKDDAEIRDKIKEITSLRAAQNEKSAVLEALLAKGKTAFEQRSWDAATTAYQEVLAQDPTNATAKAQLALIQSEMAKDQAAAKNNEEFQRLKTQGFSEAANSEWVSAKHSLEEALKIKQDTEVSNKLNEVQQKINGEVQAKKLEQDYKDAIAKAAVAEAAKDLEGALNYYSTATGLKPNEQLPKDKIAELKGLIAQTSATNAVDKKYNDLIASGDELVANQDYSGAIKKYNEALAVKPTEQLPVIKAKNAEQLAEQQKKAEQDAAFEKIITAINTKISENDFKKAREYVSTASSLRPGDPRPQVLLAKIESLEKENIVFTDFMQKAAKEAENKNYSEAISLYEKAKNIKPSHPEPIEKIAQLRQLLDEQALAMDKDKVYALYYEAGVTKQNAQEYELAVNNFKNALNAKPNDSKAIAKIAEIEAIIAKREQENKLKNEGEQAFNNLILSGDESFNSKNYKKAAEIYRQALTVKPGHAYAKKQLDEAEKLNKLEASSLANQQYQKILTAADNSYKAADYTKALEYYNQALMVKSSDPYPKKRIEEINGILNPVAESSAELQDLGEPFDGSIIDGEVALLKAEDAKKEAKRSKIKEIETNALIAQSEMNDNKKAEQIATIGTIYNLYTKILSDDRDNSLNKLEVASKVHAVEAQKSMLELQNTTYETQSNYQTRDIIDGQVAKVNHDYAVSTDKQQENHIDVERVRVEEINMTTNKSTSKHDENIAVDGTITNVSLKVQADQTKSLDGQIAIANDVDKKRVESENILLEKDVTKYNESVANKQEVESVYVSTIEKAKTSERELAENTAKIHVIDQEITDRNTADFRNKHHESIGVKENVTTINEKVSSDEAKQEVKRVENVEKLKERSTELLQEADVKNQQNALKNNDTKVLIEAQDIKTQATTELAGITHKDKVKNMNAVEASTHNASADLNKSDDQERLNTQKNLEIKKDATRERELLEEKRLENKGEQVKETSKVLSSGNTSIENEKKQSIMDAKKDIDKIEVKPVEAASAPNSLGEKYPEGVSQEMFQRKDNVGILSAIITRRVVVINGRGAEYVRTQTSHATTYTKNGKPITEYVWQKETQDAKLQRHY